MLHSHDHTAGGLTLIETLAAIGLFALVASVLGSGFLAGSDDSKLRQTKAACREADQRARLLAQRHGPVVVRVSEDNRAIYIFREDDPASLGAVELPRGATIAFRDHEGLPVYQITIDALGRSDDYSADCVVGSRSTELKFAGLTGWCAVLSRNATP